MSTEKNTSSLTGILLLDKPKGISSNQAIQRIKKHFKLRKVGHTGTLDPMATGMLPICLNETTKLAGLLLADAKTYRFTLALGRQTDTGDADGSVIREGAVPDVEQAVVEKVIKSFLGEQLQQPPMYSALKHQGKALYEYARKGIDIEREARPITIHDIQLLSHTDDSLTLKVSCSSGTYVRVLAEDIAEQLGTVGHLTALRRESISCFDGYEMYTEDQLFSAESALEQYTLNHSAVPMSLPKIIVDEAIANRLQHGQRILQSDANFPGEAMDCLVYLGAQLIGLGSVALSANHNWVLKLNKVIR